MRLTASDTNGSHKNIPDGIHNTTKGGDKMEECMFIKADEIRQLLGISRSKAYQIIRVLNAELKSQGYMVLNGKVNRNYFMKKFMIPEEV